MPDDEIFDDESSSTTGGTKSASFDLSPEKRKGILVITIAGDKGEGKTTQALAAPGTIGAITMDRKTGLIHETMYSEDPRITVYDGLRYYTDDATSKSEMTKAAARNFAYLVKLIESIKGKYDWILLDGLETLHEICEMKMRSDNGIGPTQGFANLNLWKERRFNLRAVHNAALGACNRGTIYTTYMEFQDEEKRDGQTVKGKKVPQWVDMIKKETDITIHVYREVDNKSGRIRHFAEISDSKVKKFLKGGVRIEVNESRSIFSLVGQGGATPAPVAVQSGFSTTVVAVVDGKQTPVQGPTDDVFT